jgi:hypothetical protein
MMKHVKIIHPKALAPVAAAAEPEVQAVRIIQWTAETNEAMLREGEFHFGRPVVDELNQLKRYIQGRSVINFRDYKEHYDSLSLEVRSQNEALQEMIDLARLRIVDNPKARIASEAIIVRAEADQKQNERRLLVHPEIINHCTIISEFSTVFQKLPNIHMSFARVRGMDNVGRVYLSCIGVKQIGDLVGIVCLVDSLFKSNELEDVQAQEWMEMVACALNQVMSQSGNRKRYCILRVSEEDPFIPREIIGFRDQAYNGSENEAEKRDYYQRRNRMLHYMDIRFPTQGRFFIPEQLEMVRRHVFATLQISPLQVIPPVRFVPLHERRGPLPERRDRSPERRDRSPRRRSRSPERRDRLPERRDRSPRRRSRSPERRDRSPRRRDPLYERRDRSPERRRDFLYERRDRSPRRRSRSPERRDRR